VGHGGALPPLVKAKLSPPDAGPACLRPGTLKLLGQSFQRRATVVCAPAGYGKTTVVLEALRRLSLRHIWYKLDVLDQDPVAFIASLVEALAMSHQGFGQTIRDRLANAYEVPYAIEEMVAEFVAEMTTTVADDLLLVLDDYHEAADSRSLNATLDYLITNLPATMRFVVLSRYEPAFEVGRLRLDGQLAFVGVDELRFGADEVLEVVAQRTGVSLSPDRAAALADLTEGWPASVVLAALASHWVGVESLESALSDPRLKQDVFSYLAEQVYSRQSEEVRAFLRRTCCLDYLSVDLARRVGAPRRAHRILAHLRANGVFTFATAQEGTFRYHSLFREFLRRRAIQEDGPDRFHKLQLTTADALEAHGDIERAVDLCLAANEPQRGLEIISRVGAMDLDAFRSDTLERWVERLPDDVRRREPWAHLVAGEADMRAGHFDAALQHIDSAVAGFAADGSRRDLYRALSAKERTLFWKGDTTGAAETCRQALEVADDTEQKVHALVSLGAALNAECKWGEATEALSSARRLAAGAFPAEQARLAAYTVFIAYNTGRYRDAARAADGATDTLLAFGSPSLRMTFLNLVSTNCLFMADWSEARRKLGEVRDLGTRYGFTYLQPLVDDVEVHLDSCTGDSARTDSLRRLAMQAPSIADDRYCLSMAVCHAGTAARRSGNEQEAVAYFAHAAEIAHDTSARDAYLNALVNLTYSKSLLGKTSSVELHAIAEEARDLDLLFIALKAEYFAAALSYRSGKRTEAIETLLRCVPEQLELGHLNFLSQELVLQPEMAVDVVTALEDQQTVHALLDAIARHWNSLELLVRCLAVGPCAGCAAVEAAVAHRSDAEASSVLTKAARNPYPEVRRTASRLRRRRRGGDGHGTTVALDLTPRESQILAMIADGATNAEIAQMLVLSPATVKTHVNHIFSKLGVRDRLQAAIAYRKAFTLDPAHDETGMRRPHSGRQDTTIG